VVLLRDGVAVGSTVAEGGVYTFATVNPVEGANTYTAAVGSAASGLLGAASAPLVLTLDQTAPAPPDAPDLLTTSDTGVSAADNVTGDTTPTFNGPAPDGTTVVLLDGDRAVGAATAAASAFAITSVPLADGPHPMRLTFEDLAGNVSAPGAALPVTIDNTAPRVVAEAFTGRPQARLDFTFDEDVPTIQAGFVSVVDRATGRPVGELALAYRPDTATVTFPIEGRVLPAGDYRATLSTQITDAAGNKPAAEHVFLFTAFSSVAARRTFFNNSALDGNNPAPTAADDAAVAPGKVALLPGVAAGAANVTNFSKGLNGVMVDLLAAPAVTSPSPSDFELAAGDATTFTPLPAATIAAVATRVAGGAATRRVTLALGDGAVKNTWLRVTVRAGAATGLSAPDVFYFANLVGDTGNDRGTPRVDALDLARTRAAVGRTDAASLDRFDFNRDGAINASDVLITRNNQRATLPLFTAPAAASTPRAVALADAPLPTMTSRPATRPPRRGVLDPAQPGLLA
jgi:hypothetical protein